ncbi:hypothetical protein ASG87_16995 [Frateuria sp. Soil773]|nr:hypothetical protein ASG87_16995 [Frateuria sp. Soil773]
MVGLLLACAPLAAASVQDSPSAGGTEGRASHRPLFDVKFVLVKAPVEPKEPHFDAGGELPAIQWRPLSSGYLSLGPVRSDPNVFVCRGWQCAGWPD